MTWLRLSDASLAWTITASTRRLSVASLCASRMAFRRSAGSIQCPKWNEHSLPRAGIADRNYARDRPNLPLTLIWLSNPPPMALGRTAVVQVRLIV